MIKQKSGGITIGLLITGNEVLSGDVTDTNSVLIAKELSTIGLCVQQKLTVADRVDELAEALMWMAGRCDVLIVTGGLVMPSTQAPSQGAGQTRPVNSGKLLV